VRRGSPGGAPRIAGGMGRTPTLTVARVAVAGSLVFLVAAWVAMPWVGGDTPFVLDGSNALLACLSNHDYNACGFTGRLNFWGLMTPIGYWPLLQHIPDVISIELGANSHPARTRILALLSIVGFVGAVALAWVVLTRVRQRAWFWGFLFIALSSPLVTYARTTVGEVLASGLLVGLVAATALQATPWLIGLAAFGASITKETSYPFVIALGLLGLVLARRRTGRPIRAHVLSGLAGTALAFALASLLNIVRFGSIWNTNYLDSHFRTPGIGRTLEYVAALLVSPSGGIFVFWLSACALIGAACLLPFLSRPESRLDVRPALLLLAICLALLVGLASWWTPFGWTSYGPRLSLPWILPLVLISLVAYGEALAPLAARLLAPTWRLLAIFIVVFALTLPHIGEMWRPNSTAGFFGQVQGYQSPWNGGVAQWHSAQHRLLWLEKPQPFYALHGLRTTGGAFTALAVALGLFGSLVLFRIGLAEERTVRTAREFARSEEQVAKRRTAQAAH
jgi:hypothetical protein